jgi:hypothetical protein
MLTRVANKWIKPVWPFEVNWDSPQAQGLVAWWPGFLTNATITRELIRWRNDGTLAANTTYVGDAEQRWAWNFISSSTSMITCGTDARLEPANVRAVSFWCRFASVAGFQNLARYEESSLRGWRIDKNDAHHLRAVWMTSGSAQSNQYEAILGTANVWKHVLVEFSSSGAILKIYVDGISGTLIDPGIGMSASTGGLYLGNDAGGTLPFIGRMADARIYAVAPAAATVWQMYAPQSRFDLYRPGSQRARFGLRRPPEMIYSGGPGL